MSGSGIQTDKQASTAYGCHLALAAATVLAVAMFSHLEVIGARPDVVGGALSLMLMWLGLPALMLGLVAVLQSVGARDRPLMGLSLLLSTMPVAAMLDAPMSWLLVLSVAYVVAVLGLGALRIHRRRQGVPMNR